MAINIHVRRISGLRLVFPCLFTASWPNRHIMTYRSTSGEAATEYDAEAASLGKAAEFWVAAFGLGKIDPTVDAY